MSSNSGAVLDVVERLVTDRGLDRLKGCSSSSARIGLASDCWPSVWTTYTRTPGRTDDRRGSGRSSVRGGGSSQVGAAAKQPGLYRNQNGSGGRLASDDPDIGEITIREGEQSHSDIDPHADLIVVTLRVLLKKGSQDRTFGA
jgi:hypothetical protein